MNASKGTGLRWLAAGAAMGAMGAWAAITAPGMAIGASAADARALAAADRAEIEQLMMGDYPRALDGRDWKTYGSLWASDGTFLYRGTTYTGPAAIAAVFDRPATPPAAGAAATPPARTQHVVTNLTLKLNGDRAVAQAYWQTLGVRTGQEVILGSGHYEDELRRENGRWKFAKRAIVNDLPPPALAAAAAATPAAR